VKIFAEGRGVPETESTIPFLQSFNLHPSSFGTVSAFLLVMSVAAGIEISAGGRPAQGLSPASGHVLSTGLDGASATGSSLATVSVAKSFRTSWQSVLASLGAGLDGTEKEWAGEEGIEPSVEAALAKPDQTLSSTALRQGGGAVRFLPQSRVPQGHTAESQRELSLPAARAGIQGGQTVSLVSRRAASDALESTLGAHAAEPGKKAGLNATVALSVADIASAMAGNVAFVMPAQGEASQAAIKLQMQPSAADISTGLPGSSTRSSGQPHLTGVEGAAVGAGRASSAGNHSKDTDGTQTLSEKAPDAAVSPAGRDSTFLEGSSGTKPESSGVEAAPGRSRGQIEAPSETPAQSQNQTQPGSQGFEAVPAPIGSADTDRGLAGSEDATKQLAEVGQATAVLPMAGKPGLAGSGRTTKQDAQRLAHASGAGDPTGKGTGLPNGQPASADPNAYAVAHDPAGAHGTTIDASSVIGSSSGHSSGPDSAETFAALDAGAVPGKPAWVHAGAQRAEVGFQDPDLGWVGVRADLSGGGVHAALVPGSANAAVTLGGHLAGLNSYLAEQHTPVETLTLAAPENREAGLGAGQDMNQGMSQGFNQGESPHAGQGAGAESPTNRGPGVSSTSVAASQEVSAGIGRTDGMGFGQGSGGIHISVMA
jgi:hypothetical protein